MIPIHHLPAHVLRNEIAEKRLTAEELTRIYLDRIHLLGLKNGVNAVCEINEAALCEARALDNKLDNNPTADALPLFGLPVLIKDNIDVKGLHTTAGSVALKDHIASEDAPVIKRLRKSGAIILGKTNMTEFANYMTDGLPNGFSSRGGQVVNAYHPDHNPGGSSTGSAVAVSLGLCAFAIGTDTCFSIVGCAAQNGVTGFKPAGGRLPGDGVIPICYALDMPGPLTRDVNDAHMVYSALCESPVLPLSPTPAHKLRIAVNTFDRDQVSKEQLDRYENLFANLKKEGAAISEICQPSASVTRRNVMRYAFKHDLEAYLRASNAPRKTLKEIIAYYEEDIKTRAPYGVTVLQMAEDVASGNLDENAYHEALKEREEIKERIVKELSSFDACLMTGHTDVMHTINLPSITVNLCMAEDGTPRGAILYGADEEKLLNAAATIERLVPGVVPPKM
ncbi:MAG: amidase [Clostridia bacterium]|nr:amidase [Clostridia bacterium]